MAASEIQSATGYVRYMSGFKYSVPSDPSQLIEGYTVTIQSHRDPSQTFAGVVELDRLWTLLLAAYTTGQLVYVVSHGKKKSTHLTGKEYLAPVIDVVYLPPPPGEPV